jgi:hypothetical protein
MGLHALHGHHLAMFDVQHESASMRRHSGHATKMQIKLNLRNWHARAVFAVLTFLMLGTVPAQAAIVTGPHTTNAGKQVNLQGLAWLSLDMTRGISRDAVESGYGGLTSDGWRYATRNETANLLQSLWGGTTQGFTVDNGDGAVWFFTYLGQGPLEFLGAVIRNFFYGDAGECTPDLAQSCLGSYGVLFSNVVGNPPQGSFALRFGLDDAWPLPETVDSSLQEPTFGNLLVRGNAIPEPGTLMLVGVGGAALFRKKTKILHHARNANS